MRFREHEFKNKISRCVNTL